jgi:hypothetical protein
MENINYDIDKKYLHQTSFNYIINCIYYKNKCENVYLITLKYSNNDIGYIICDTSFNDLLELIILDIDNISSLLYVMNNLQQIFNLPNYPKYILGFLNIDQNLYKNFIEPLFYIDPKLERFSLPVLRRNTYINIYPLQKTILYINNFYPKNDIYNDIAIYDNLYKNYIRYKNKSTIQLFFNKNLCQFLKTLLLANVEVAGSFKLSNEYSNIFNIMVDDYTKGELYNTQIPNTVLNFHVHPYKTFQTQEQKIGKVIYSAPYSIEDFTAFSSKYPENKKTFLISKNGIYSLQYNLDFSNIIDSNIIIYKNYLIPYIFMYIYKFFEYNNIYSLRHLQYLSISNFIDVLKIRTIFEFKNFINQPLDINIINIVHQKHYNNMGLQEFTNNIFNSLNIVLNIINPINKDFYIYDINFYPWDYIETIGFIDCFIVNDNSKIKIINDIGLFQPDIFYELIDYIKPVNNIDILRLELITQVKIIILRGILIGDTKNKINNEIYELKENLSNIDLPDIDENNDFVINNITDINNKITLFEKFNTFVLKNNDIDKITYFLNNNDNKIIKLSGNNVNLNVITSYLFDINISSIEEILRQEKYNNLLREEDLENYLDYNGFIIKIISPLFEGYINQDQYIEQYEEYNKNIKPEC